MTDTKIEEGKGNFHSMAKRLAEKLKRFAEKAISALKNFFGESFSDGEKSYAAERNILLARLRETSFALEEIGRATEKLTSEQENPKISLTSVAGRTAQALCAACPKKECCWESDCEVTPLAFKEMLFAIRRGAKPDLSENFVDICEKSGEIFDHLKKDYEREAVRNNAKLRIAGARKTLSRQFSGTSKLFQSMEKELSELIPAEKKLTSQIEKVFGAHNVPLTSFACFYREKDRLTVEAVTFAGRIKSADMKAIKKEVGELCSAEMVISVKEAGIDAQKIILTEKPPLKAEFGFFSINAEGEKFCGDCKSAYLDGKGNAVLVLCDGMGSGKAAAKSAFLASGYVSKLQRAGFDMKTSMDIVNSALVLKSDEESFSTVDTAVIDLFSGRTDFCKSGAAPSFVLRKNKVKIIESASLPVGLLEGGECKCHSETLSKGDIVVLVSDGVTATGERWLPSEIRSLSQLSAEETARELAKTALRRRNDRHSDDITVLVAKLSENT